MGFLWENGALTIGKGVFNNNILLFIVHEHAAFSKQVFEAGCVHLPKPTHGFV